jgi:hypothetical protein
MEKRIITIVVEVDQNSDDKDWIWESLKRADTTFNGVKVKAIAEGNSIKEVEELENQIDEGIEEVSEDVDPDFRAGVILPKLKEAIQIIREGKYKFTPMTTNSNVDTFLHNNLHYIGINNLKFFEELQNEHRS